jgi:hypothetical protein
MAGKMKQNENKPIRLTKHAREQCIERGASEDEVRQAIGLGEWEEAKKGRFMARLNLQFGRSWAGNVYPIKQVAPVFIVEESEIVVITVYTFYF